LEPILVLVQVLNGLQLGVLLFLVAAGLTLVFGIMDVINLAHGVQYMLGAYLAASLLPLTGGLLAAALLALPLTVLIGLALDRLVLRHLYARGHLAQVAGTFGLILVVNDLVRLLWGPAPLAFPVPAALDLTVPLAGGATYPAYRLAIIAAGLAVALLLWLLVARTRFGMLVRAGAANPGMLRCLGVDVGAVFLAVTGLGAMLAGFAGLMAGPLVAVQPGMGDGILILAFVVVVTGGLGSVQGAFAGAMLVGLADTLGRSFLTDLVRQAAPPAVANEVGPALASMTIYLVMAAVLVVAPRGLIPARAAAR
jgi:branched-chain amino acid transport system permease protein